MYVNDLCVNVKGFSWKESVGMESTEILTSVTNQAKRNQSFSRPLFLGKS